MAEVSVIIPTYNRANLIKRAISSVARQTFKDLEIIVIDDGSEDDTDKIVQNIADSRIRYKKIDHSGVSRARNEGIKLSRGRWIAFIDSDDEWLDTKIEKQLKYLENHPQYLACHTDEIWIKDGVRINQGKKHKKYAGNFFLPSLKMCLISPSSIIIQRDIFTEIGGFDESFKYVEDYELWLRLTSKYEVGYINEKLVIKYGGHNNQLSSKIDGIEKYRMMALEKFIKNNHSNDLLKGHVDQAFKEYIRKFHIYSLGCLKRGKIKELSKLRHKYEELESLLNNRVNIHSLGTKLSV
ncbi:MAG: glycosyltransferase family 2 protein [Spirochaetes bacterium]|nr:MAG: glycosyltransferase family 2 protein [Spirochaetota bacterium]